MASTVRWRRGIEYNPWNHIITFLSFPQYTNKVIDTIISQHCFGRRGLDRDFRSLGLQLKERIKRPWSTNCGRKRQKKAKEIT